MASPPPEAADGFDANAPPSSPAVAPPPHLRDTPPSDVADFSIDGDAVVGGGDVGAASDPPPEAGRGADANGGGGGTTKRAKGASEADALARKTDAIMSSYKDYIDQITSEPVEGAFRPTVGGEGGLARTRRTIVADRACGGSLARAVRCRIL